MSTKSEIKIDIATENQRHLALAVREKVFVKELGIPKSEDFDENDGAAVHILAYLEQNNRRLPIGTMRIRFFGCFAKFERMAVLPHFRRTSLANDIMNYGFWYASCMGFREVRGMCKKELLPRWKRCGFEKIEDIQPFRQNGMDLISIRRLLPENPYAQIITSSPKHLNAREGHWFDDEPELQKKSFILKNILSQKRLKD